MGRLLQRDEKPSGGPLRPSITVSQSVQTYPNRNGAGRGTSIEPARGQNRLAVAEPSRPVTAPEGEREMAWPQSQDYNEAIQNPSTCFKDADLKGGKPTLNALGMPLPCSGNFADVYQITSVSGSRWAVKCFTRGEPASLRRRYAEIDAHLQKAKLPFAVGFQFLDQGLRVKGVWHPALKMQWVEGLTLNQFVRERLDKPALLDALLSIWSRMGRRLREADLAHADLQHGNVLLVPGASANALGVKLIDYDGMWVPAMAGEQSGEVGHPAYQHPQRLQDGTYSREVDRFPLLVVAAALRCLRLGGRVLWERYDNGDNLLFREEDLKEPGRSPLFAELRQLPDTQARLLVGKLEEACGRPLEQAPHLDELLPELAAPITARKPAAAATSSSAVTAQPVATGEPGSAFADLGEPTGAP